MTGYSKSFHSGLVVDSGSLPAGAGAATAGAEDSGPGEKRKRQVVTNRVIRFPLREMSQF